MKSPIHHNHLFQKGLKPQAIGLVLILLFAAWLRFDGLGARSLWADEFCTWKVAQLPVGESLRWQPELTKPPLYQFVLRGITGSGTHRDGTKVHQDAPYDGWSPVVHHRFGHADSGRIIREVPDEWHLRLPAAICGTLAVAAMWWLGSLAGGWTLGTAAGLLFAVQLLQIDYSQEARPYSMLVLGSIVSTSVWCRLNYEIRNSKVEIRKRGAIWIWPIAYVVVTAITFHANYLMVLTVAAHACWALLRLISIDNRKSEIDNLKIATCTLSMTALVCVPMAWHFLRHRTSVFQGLNWIAPPSLSGALRVLGEITFGSIWIWGLLVPALVMLMAATCWQKRVEPAADERRWTQIFGASGGRNGFYGLLLMWLVAVWGGLLAISWLAHPALVARYALPAAAPAILIPLMVLHRFDRRLPLLVAGLFVAGTAPVWLTRAERVKPGFREMVAFLDEFGDPELETVVVAIERTTSPGWEEMDLLGFEYYGSHEATKPQSHEAMRNNEATSQDGEGSEATRQRGKEEIRHEVTRPNAGGRASPRKHEVEVLYLRNGRPDGDQPILRDLRAMWVVAFLADPIPAIESAGRRTEQIRFEDRVFELLYFEPYRLIRVASVR